MLAPYRARRYFPDGPMLECHTVPGRPCAGLLREMRERLRADGDYFRAQTWFRADEDDITAASAALRDSSTAPRER